MSKPHVGMKVLIITAMLPPSRCGGADYALRYCRELAEAGLSVYVLTGKSGTLNNESFSVLPLVPSWNWQDCFSILSTIRKLRPDVIDIHFTGWMYNDQPMITFLPSLIRRLLPGVRIVVHIESLGGIKRSESSLVTLTQRWLWSVCVGRRGINYEYGSLLRDSDAVIFLNERDRGFISNTGLLRTDLLATVIPPPPIMPVAPPPGNRERERVRHEQGISEDDVLLAFYGYLYPGKGLETLFKALSMMQSKKLHLWILGDTPEQYVLERCGHPTYKAELIELSRSLGVEEQIRWHGYADGESTRTSELLRVVDICILPFDDGVMLNNSSFSFAAAHGIPIITTRSIYTEREFIAGENCSLVPPRDPAQLAGATQLLLNDKSMAVRLADGALKFAEEKFNWKTAIAKTVSMYRLKAPGASSTGDLMLRK